MCQSDLGASIILLVILYVICMSGGCWAFLGDGPDQFSYGRSVQETGTFTSSISFKEKDVLQGKAPVIFLSIYVGISVKDVIICKSILYGFHSFL